MQRKHKAAFFDVDNTLLNLKSMFSFQEYFYANAPETRRGRETSYADFVAQLQTHPARHDRLALNRLFYESFKGRRRSEVVALAEQWFRGLNDEHGDKLWIRSALDLANALREEGHLLVAVSGSCHEILGPVLRHLAFDHCLATNLEVHEDIYTGKILPPQVIGEGKAQVIAQFGGEHSLDVAACVACGDHITDIAMLEAVGMQYVVAGDPALESIAASRKWPVLDAADALHAQMLAHV